MPFIEQGVTRHYAAYNILARLKEGLRAMGYESGGVPPEVIKPVDEFHIGGAEATAALLGKLDLDGKDVLDIGCGIGGPARTMLRWTASASA